MAVEAAKNAICIARLVQNMLWFPASLSGWELSPQRNVPRPPPRWRQFNGATTSAGAAFGIHRLHTGEMLYWTLSIGGHHVQIHRWNAAGRPGRSVSWLISG